MIKLTIDRFEGSYAICESEDKSTISIPKYRLPLNCKEGDCLIQDDEGMYQMEAEATTIKEKRIRDKMSRLFE
ncbi:MAG: hypothetical protein K0S01_220 [Herbinix sp.]|jgi:hypothetical protein|nr:hypothetical protein [Herbinix sp.]